MCDLIKVSSIQILAVVERLYAAPILCGARRDLALESGMHMVAVFSEQIHRSPDGEETVRAQIVEHDCNDVFNR